MAKKKPARPRIITNQSDPAARSKETANIVTDRPDPNVMPDITGPGGLESNYRPEFPKMLIEHMGQGLSFEAFGGVVDAGTSTMYQWLKDYAPFQEAKRIGTNRSRIFWEKLGVYYGVEGRTMDIKDASGKVIGKTKNSEKLNASIYRLNMANNQNQTGENQMSENQRQMLYLALLFAGSVALIVLTYHNLYPSTPWF